MFIEQVAEKPTGENHTATIPEHPIRSMSFRTRLVVLRFLLNHEASAFHEQESNHVVS